MSDDGRDQLALVRTLRDQTRALEAENAQLRKGSGGPPRDGGIDDRIAAVEARTDAKFAELRADLADRFGDLKAELAKRATTGTVISTAIALFVAVLAILAFGGAQFSGGMSARSVASAAASDQEVRDHAQDRKLDAILACDHAQDRKLDAILARLPRDPAGRPGGSATVK